MSLPSFSRALAPLLLSASSTAHACTVCDSATAHSVRAGIFNGHFLSTLLLVMLPGIVLTAAAPLVALVVPPLDDAPSPTPSNLMHSQAQS